MVTCARSIRSSSATLPFKKTHPQKPDSISFQRIFAMLGSTDSWVRVELSLGFFSSNGNDDDVASVNGQVSSYGLDASRPLGV